MKCVTYNLSNHLFHQLASLHEYWASKHMNDEKEDILKPRRDTFLRRDYYKTKIANEPVVRDIVIL